MQQSFRFLVKSPSKNSLLTTLFITHTFNTENSNMYIKNYKCKE